MDWHRPFKSSYRFSKVSRVTGYEVGSVSGIIGGKISINQDSAIFESADLQTVEYIDLGSDFIRAYLDAEQDGITESVCLGTWDASIPSRDIDGYRETCTAYCDGLLAELRDDSFEAPVVVQEGENIISYAVGIAGTLPTVATPSDKVLGAEWVFGLDGDNGGSKLDALNSLLSLAGYSSASTDPMGNIVMSPYVDPASRNPVWTFEEGAGATFLKQATEERDTRDVSNVVLAIYESQGETTIGTAIDDDPNSPYSVQSMGRRKVAKYKYNSTATQAQADAKASELLKTNQSVVHRVTLKHIHCPARVGDVVRVKWPSAGIDATFVIRTQTIEIGSAGCMTTSELRRFVRR